MLMSLRCISKQATVSFSTTVRLYSKFGPTDLKGRKVAAQKWLIRQHNDPYVKRAQKEQYRCRSAYKLLELDDKYAFLRPGAVVVDLGASPGAWSQVAVNRVNALGADPGQPRGRVISVDIQHMLSLEGATVLAQSDFTQDVVQQRILSLLDNNESLSPEHDKNIPALLPSDFNVTNNTSESGIPVDDPRAPSPDRIDTVKISSAVNHRRADVLLSDMAPSATGVKSLDHQLIVSLATSVLRFSFVGLARGGTCVVKLWRGCETDKLTEAMRKGFVTVREVKPRASRSDSSEIFVLATDFNL